MVELHAGGLGTASVGNVSTGVRAAQDFGRAYIAGAFAYGVHFASTSRAFAGETYAAAFLGQSVCARRGRVSLQVRDREHSPFLAGRTVSFSSPAYNEAGSGTGTFALSYSAATSIETRSEVGIRLDTTFDTGAGGNSKLSGMLGWAHYFSRGRTAAAGFVNLPGTQFVTQGAVGASDTALVSLGMSHRFASGTSVSLDADREFGWNTIGYTARARVGWRW